MAEHVGVINRCSDLREAAAHDDLPGLQAAAKSLADLLEPHTAAEEAGLFPALGSQQEFSRHVDRLCAEHRALDERLAAIVTGDAGDVDAFIHALREHINTEENGLFPAAAIALDGPAWENIDAVTPAASTTARAHRHEH